jgi:hypothetical protein
MVQRAEDCEDPEKVKEANPHSMIEALEFAEMLASPTLNRGDFDRLKCNRPTRSSETAISDGEWDEAFVEEEIPGGGKILDGLDVAWKWDTTALAPFWEGKKYGLLGESTVIAPPRDGSTLHPDTIKEAIIEHHELYTIAGVVMDTSKAEDIAGWIEDELGIEVIDQPQGNNFKVAEYNAFTERLRNGTLKHTGGKDLESHVKNAVARRLPGGDFRFDRPSAVRQNKKAQDRRVIDALTAASMVVEAASRHKPKRSVYADR